MNLKYLFCGAIVATTLQLKSSEGENQGKAFLSPEGLKELLETIARRAAADPEYEKKEKKIQYKLSLRDHLDTTIKNSYSDLVRQANRHRELLNDLKEKPENENTQQRIQEVEKKLSYLNKELKRLKKELDELLEVLYE